MGQRVATGAMLIVFLIILLYFGGVVMGVGAIVCLCFAMQEEYHALAVAGHRPVAWPTWLGMVLAVPLVALYGSEMIVPLLAGVCLLTMICVVFRDEPRLEDAVLSVLPLFTIVLPGMCIVALAQVQPKALQVVLLSLVFAIPVVGDTMAFFVGSRVRGPKLCPAVSPNKTISGAVAGLLGSLVAAAVVGVVSLIFCDQAAAHLVAVCAAGPGGRRGRTDGRLVRFPGEAALRHQGLFQPVPGARGHAGPPGQHPVHGGGDDLLPSAPGHLSEKTLRDGSRGIRQGDRPCVR